MGRWRTLFISYYSDKYEAVHDQYLYWSLSPDSTDFCQQEWLWKFLRCWAFSLAWRYLWQPPNFENKHERHKYPCPWRNSTSLPQYSHDLRSCSTPYSYPAQSCNAVIMYYVRSPSSKCKKLYTQFFTNVTV